MDVKIKCYKVISRIFLPVLFCWLSSLSFITLSAALETTTTTTTGCMQSKLDLVIVLDSSGSVGSRNFARTRKFTSDIITNLNVAPQAVRVAIVRFSTRAHIITYLNHHMDKDEKLKAIKSMRYRPGLTYTDRAFEVVNNSVLTSQHGDREDVSDFIILATDGESVYPQRTERYASELKKRKGLMIMAIGIGTGVKKSELGIIASGPSFVYRVDFTNLWQVVKNISYVTCTETIKSLKTTVPSPTPDLLAASSSNFDVTNSKFTIRLKSTKTPKAVINVTEPVTTTKRPIVTTKTSDNTTPKPIHTTTLKPIDTTKKPDTTTSKPILTTTLKPIDTTKKPDTTTPKPIFTTTLKPIDTTKKPDTTTPKPILTITLKPIDTTRKPDTTTPKPILNITPTVTTTQHDTTTPKPIVTTTQPDTTTTKPIVTTTQINTTIPKHIVKTTQSDTTTSKLIITTTKHDTTTPNPIITTTKPNAKSRADSKTNTINLGAILSGRTTTSITTKTSSTAKPMSTTSPYESTSIIYSSLARTLQYSIDATALHQRSSQASQTQNGFIQNIASSSSTSVLSPSGPTGHAHVYLRNGTNQTSDEKNKSNVTSARLRGEDKNAMDFTTVVMAAGLGFLGVVLLAGVTACLAFCLRRKNTTYDERKSISDQTKDSDLQNRREDHNSNNDFT